MLHSPYLLRRLKRIPSKIGDGLFHADVYRLTSQGRKKKSQLAIAIDNEGIEIYDVRSSKLLTSYPVSPLLYFSCAPHSIVHGSNRNESQRSTICALRGSQTQIQCFVEHLGQKNGIAQVKSFSKTLSYSEAPFIYVDTVLSVDGHSIFVLALQKDGNLHCFSQDLSIEYWTSPVVPKNHTVHAASIISSAEALKGILRGREDLQTYAEISSDPGEAHQSNILILLSRGESITPETPRESTIRLCKLAARSLLSQESEHALSRPQTLVEWTLPTPQITGSSKFLYHFDRHCGGLSQWANRSYVTYDLTGSLPKVGNVIQFDDTISSLLRISPRNIATVNQKSLNIIDARYSSTQASFPLPNLGADLPQISGPSPDEDGTTQTFLCSYFTKTSILVVLHRQKLIVFQVAGTSSSQRGTLAAAIAKGMHLDSNEGFMIKSQNDGFPVGRRIDLKGHKKKWTKYSTKLIKLAEDRDESGFDRLFEECLKQLVGLEDASEPLKMAISYPRLLPNVHRIRFIISKLFATWRDDNASRRTLRATFLPPETYRWLAKNGFLTAHSIEQALKENRALALESFLPTEAVVEALAIFDPSIQKLQELLKVSPYLSTHETCCALRHLVLYLRKTRSVPFEKLIEFPSEVVKETQDAEMEDINGGPSSNKSMNSEPSRPEYLRESLHWCLEGLAQSGEPEIKRALSKEFPLHELLVLVDFLRMELASEGWLSRYVEDQNSPSEDKSSHQNEHITTIIRILGCAVDCLGQSAWLRGHTSLISPQSSPLESLQTIAYMKAEISAALEGIEEASYLSGLLHEILLYSEVAVPEATKDRRAEKGRLKGGAPSKIPLTVLAGELESSSLPLGLKPPDYIDKEKKEPGRKVQVRSAREIGQLKSRKVEKYSFERIMI